MTVNCPSCGGKTDVIDSRGDGSVIKRRRRCRTCNKTFGTLESSRKRAYEYACERDDIMIASATLRKAALNVRAGRMRVGEFLDLIEENLDNIDRIIK